VASYATMMRRDRKREGLRVCRAAWLIGVSVREYREIEGGERFPNFVTWDRVCKLHGGAADGRRWGSRVSAAPRPLNREGSLEPLRRLADRHPRCGRRGWTWPLGRDEGTEPPLGSSVG
jgi:hypothetical protein